MDNVAEPTAVAIADGVKLVFVSAGVPPEPPSIISDPQDLGLFPGQNGEFSVTADGTPPLRYQWRFKGADIPGATSATLVIPAARAAGAGTYSARGTNGLGAALRAVAPLPLNPVLANLHHACD